MHRLTLVGFLLAVSWAPWAQAQQALNQPQDLSSLSIEALMDLRVTSVSRKSEPLSRAAAAIYVLTQEDIRRSGATSIPELLRTVPGLDVAQMDASTWAISARGFNTQYASYMLVLVDGRTVYNPTFNGVYWAVQDTVLEDIDRIEVICGPAAALWGQNAVNGVINITTKQASESQGALVAALAGTQETPHVSVRYGGAAGNKGFYRIFGKYFNRQEQHLPSGLPSPDGWRSLRAGFRADWDLSDRDSLTVLADGFRSLERHRQNQILSLLPPVQQEVVNRVRTDGADVLLRWRRAVSGRSDLTVDGYYDYEDQADPSQTLRHTADLNFQHHIVLSPRHDLLWGAGWRYATIRASDGFLVSFQPSVDVNPMFSVFGQDEMTLWPDRLRFVLGARFTHDRFLDSEIQPDARLLWTPHPRHAVWLALSRAISSPSFSGRAVRFSVAALPGPGGLSIVPTVLGNPGLHGSHATSFQAGYRGRPGRNFSLSLAGYYTDYEEVQSSSPDAPSLELDPPPAHLLLPLLFENGLRGATYGSELEGTWQASSRWRLSASHTLLFMTLRDIVPGTASTGTSVPGNNPRNQFQVKSYLSLPRTWEMDLFSYYVDRLPADDVPAYVRLDARIGWQPAEHLALSVMGQNLLQPRHAEFGAGTASIYPTLVRRSAYAKLVWTF
jgi:iron complex outermembrane receptor protein